MTLVRADLGTPRTTTCPRCRSGYALEHPIYVLRDDGVHLDPWVLITCRACGHLGKAQTAAA